MNTFKTPKPVRVRLEGEEATFDAIVPAAIVAFPDMKVDGREITVAMSGSAVQKAQLVAAIIRMAIIDNTLGAAMQFVATEPINARLIPPENRADRPLDDIPPHLRGG